MSSSDAGRVKRLFFSLQTSHHEAAFECADDQRAFDDPNWIFELKYDGFRAFAAFERGRAKLISRNGHQFASFPDLAKQIADELPNVSGTVIDGEIVCLDDLGIPQFSDLLFHRG